jgi:hypothetical protein
VFSKRAVFVALALAIVLVALVTVTAFAADPTPEASGLLIDPLDPRAGAGANRVGAPFVALVAVVGIGLLSALATALYVRFSRAR